VANPFILPNRAECLNNMKIHSEQVLQQPLVKFKKLKVNKCFRTEREKIAKHDFFFNLNQFN
jgi:hypothetical protein